MQFQFNEMCYMLAYKSFRSFNNNPVVAQQSTTSNQQKTRNQFLRANPEFKLTNKEKACITLSHSLKQGTIFVCSNKLNYHLKH